MINCKTIAAERKQKMKEYIDKNNLNITLAVFQVGDNPASNSYIKGKHKDCDEVGVDFLHIKYDESVSTEEIIRDIQWANINTSINGIIVQLPLPKHLDQGKILNEICDEKDVDGFKHNSPFVPCTPKGVMMILDHIGYDVDGKLCCVIGRGAVGKPMVDELTAKNATVLWCNSHTPEKLLDEYVMISDVVISAAGVPKLIHSYTEDQIIIDVGINRDEDGKLCGDVDKDCYHDDFQITPVPGGVGLMIRVALLENTVYGGKR